MSNGTAGGTIGAEPAAACSPWSTLNARAAAAQAHAAVHATAASSTGDPPPHTIDDVHSPIPVTPFIIEPEHFEQQDIFDLTTFNHLVAESALDAGRVAKRKSNDSIQPSAVPSASSSFHHSSSHPNVRQRPQAHEWQKLPWPPAPHADRPAPPASSSFVAAHGLTVGSLHARTREERHAFRKLVREMHQAEVAAIIQADPTLARCKRQIDAYRAEHAALKRACDAKVARLESELSQLQRRNEKLHELSLKQQSRERKNSLSTASTVSASSSSNSCASCASTCTASSSFASSSPHCTCGTRGCSLPSSRYSSPATTPLSHTRSIL